MAELIDLIPDVSDDGEVHILLKFQLGKTGRLELDRDVFKTAQAIQVFRCA